MAAQDRHAVIGFLAKGRSLIAGFFESVVRKLVVGELELLQAQGVHRVAGQPGQHLRQAHGQGVDVPGGNTHKEFILLI
ncbi:hypothetical protein D3C71_1736920 [compost metagenome]